MMPTASNNEKLGHKVQSELCAVSLCADSGPKKPTTASQFSLKAKFIYKCTFKLFVSTSVAFSGLVSLLRSLLQINLKNVL